MFNRILRELSKVLSIFLLICSCFYAQADKNKVLVRYFYQAGCRDCEKINNEVLPEVEEFFPGRYMLEKNDVDIKENFLKLASLQEKFNITTNEPVSIFIGGNFALTGFDEIRKNIRDCIEKSLTAAPSRKSDNFIPADKILSTRAEKFTLFTVIAAGLLDGINPCVFSTLIFLISILALNGNNIYRTTAAGITYCFSCFISYFALGFGVFNFVRMFNRLDVLRNIMETIIFLMLLILALISFRDAWCYKKSGSVSSVVLQMPERLKTFAHSIIKKGLNYRFIIPGAFVLGILITAIETACTGQIYLPTLVFMTRESADSMKWLFLLTLYNLMYILPLVFIFAAFISGTKIKSFLEISRKNVFISKMATGIFFIVLAIILFIS